MGDLPRLEGGEGSGVSSLPRHINTILLDLIPQRIQRHAQIAGGLALVVAIAAQDALDVLALYVFEFEGGMGGRLHDGSRQVLRADQLLLAEHVEALDEVLQLADVAGEGVGQQEVQGGRGELEGVRAQELALLVLQQELDQPFHFQAAPLLQGRQLQVNDGQAVVEVPAEAALFAALLHILVSGGEEAHVNLPPRAADGGDLFFLDDAQQHLLHIGRDVADLVEEDGAAFGGLEDADAVFVGTGEAPFFEAEEPRFEQIVAQRGAVDRLEGHVPARRMAVDKTGQVLLTGTAFPQDEHGRVHSRGHPFRLRVDGLQALREAEALLMSRRRIVAQLLADDGAGRKRIAPDLDLHQLGLLPVGREAGGAHLQQAGVELQGHVRQDPSRVHGRRAGRDEQVELVVAQAEQQRLDLRLDQLQIDGVVHLQVPGFDLVGREVAAQGVAEVLDAGLLFIGRSVKQDVPIIALEKITVENQSRALLVGLARLEVLVVSHPGEE